MYQSWVLPTLNYCDVVWGNAANKYMCTLTTLQNRAGKTILKVNRRFPTKSMLECLGWKDLDTRRLFHLNTMVFKSITENVPRYLCNIFQKVSDNSPYQTRGSEHGNLVPPKIRISTGKRTFRYRGAISWNRLPVMCKNPLPPSTKNFKKVMKNI